MSRIDRRIASERAWVETEEVFIALYRRQQRIEQGVDRGHELGRSLIGALKLQHDRHLLIEIDAARIGERLRGAAEERRAVACVGRGRFARFLQPAGRTRRIIRQARIGAETG